MPVVQTKISMPARKAGRLSKVEKVMVEETRARTRSGSRSKAPTESEPFLELEDLPKQRRGRPKKDETPQPLKSPVKRSLTPVKTETGGSTPSKQSKTPSKSAMSSRKENTGAPSTPSTHLAKLSLASPRHPQPSPRQPLTPKHINCNSPGLKRGPLFSPQKMTVESIANLLDSPEKKNEDGRKPRTPLKPSNPQFTSPVKGVAVGAPLDPVFLSPLKPALKAKTPAKSPRLGLPSASPQRMSVDQLEDLLCSPVKSPLKKVVVSRSPRKCVTPVKLSNSPLKRSLFSPSKGPTPAAAAASSSLFKADVSEFQAARAALHTGTPSTLLCRDVEVGLMSSWLDTHLVLGSPGSIYVSGAPGTGKTATLVSLLKGKVAKYRSVFINCMVLKSAIAIYREVAIQLNPKANPKTEKAALKTIEEAITGTEEMTLLVLDEVDQLESKDQSVLYTVFEWPALQGSRLALVGIANSLDLTDRVLPRLQVKEAYRPTLLHYPPYTKQQLIDIITARLKEGSISQGSSPVITPRAIAFLASKISSLSGDLRKALDVCRRALELAEGMVRKQTLLKPLTPKGLAQPLTSPRKGYKSPKVLPQIGQVDLPQIMKVVNQVYGSQVTASLGTKGEGLPVQQKILIASLLLMVKKGRTKEVTLGKLIDTYCKVLKKRNMKPELESSCVAMIEMLESRGMVTYVCKGAPRMAKVSLRMDEDEVGTAFGDKAMLGAIIEDTICIAK